MTGELEDQEADWIHLPIGCGCHKKTYVPVDKLSLEFHKCYICHQKVEGEDPQIYMMSCQLLKSATQPFIQGPENKKSICTKCVLDQMWFAQVAREESEFESQEAIDMTRKARNKQLI